MLLSLAMMVKNEERFLEDALLSARGWVDEMVVVDTGSTDRTVEIAQDLGAKVSFFPWVNDFSKARNETIRRSSGAWVAILDADERFRGPHPENVRALLTPDVSGWPYHALMLNVVNQNLDGLATHSFFSPRIFPRHEDIGYVGRVHNSFGSISLGEAKRFEMTRCEGLEIVHLGYDKTVYEERGKLERNLELLKAAVREEPEVARYRFYLGREYIITKQYEEAKRLLKSVFKDEALNDAMLRSEAYTNYLTALNKSGAPFEEVLATAVEALELNPYEADAWYFLSLAYEQQGLTEEAMSALTEGLVSLRHKQLHTSRLATLRGERATEAAIYWAQQGDQERAEPLFAEALEHTPPDHTKRRQVVRVAVGFFMMRQDHDRVAEGLEELCSFGGSAYEQVLEGLALWACWGKPRAVRGFAKRLASLHPSLARDPRVVSAMRRS
jgi:glycosyltransferase involved in cell wall biosynthesis